MAEVQAAPDQEPLHGLGRPEGDEVDEEEEEEEEPLEPEDIDFMLRSAVAVVKPVVLTMCIAAWVVVNIHPRGEDGRDSSDLNAYTVYDEQDDDGAGGGGGGDSGGEALSKAVINALAIVGGIIAITCVIILCYKFKLIKCLIAYLVFSFCLLLYTIGATLAQQFFLLRQWPVDYISFVAILVNFAIVGAYAIFFGHGVDLRVGQFYLVCISVMSAYSLAGFSDTLAWVLLFALALYDLFAVLSPCGPLKILVKMMHSGEAEPLPGLLYETRLDHAGPPPPSSGDRRGDLRGEEETEMVPRFTAANPPPPPSGPAPAHARMGGDEDAAMAEAIAVAQAAEAAEAEEAAAAAAAAAAALDAEEDEAAQDDLRLPDRADEADERGDEVGEYVAGQTSVKLGLGDFVFYSVLVAKAGTTGFGPCIVSILTVVAGLLMTLVLLAVTHKPLPALPISIFLGLLSFVMARYLLVGLVEGLAGEGFVV